MGGKSLVGVNRSELSSWWINSISFDIIGSGIANTPCNLELNINMKYNLNYLRA